jgi:CP family cyanate transporter-like MFS transporter
LISGALLASGGTEPLRTVLGDSWRAALAIWSVPAALALAVWLAVRPAAARPSARAAVRSGAGDGSVAPAPDGREWSPWRDRGAWMVTLYMGGQSLLYYAPLAWLAARYTDLGWSAGEAGGLLALFSATQVLSALVAPSLARRDPRPAIAGSLLITIAFLALIGVAPLSAPAVWAALLGIGVGANFALALTVVGQIAPTPAATPKASGMAFFVGYLLASIGPVAVGFLHDRTGGFRTPYLVLAAFGLPVLVAGLAAGQASRKRTAAVGPLPQPAADQASCT